MTIKKLISWSEKEFAALPWRANRTLYRTLVSEIMLQQTTVSTVKNHYERFLQTFPTLQSLAAASEEELLVAWKGLGYYRRARSLKKIAEAIVEEHGGEFPEELEKLQEIPGIGPYTASALRAIGMDKPALAVDANLERVIARMFGLEDEKGPKLMKRIQELFREKEIFAGKGLSPRGLNEALMDLGRTYCQARKASCDLCFLKSTCVAAQSGKPLNLPRERKSLSEKEQHELHLLRCYVVKDGKLLVYRKDEGEWLAGQFEVPTFVVKTTDAKLTQYPAYKGNALTDGKMFKTGITKYKITNSVHVVSEKHVKQLGFTRALEWRELTDPQANFSTATVKGIKLISN